MIRGTNNPAGRAQNALLLASVGIALGSFAVLTLANYPTDGLALAIGLVLGAVNGRLVARSVNSGLPISLTSLARLMLFSMLALGLGLVIGFQHVWLVILGLGVSQLIWASINALEAIRR